MTQLASLVAEGLRRNPAARAAAVDRPHEALLLMGETGRQIVDKGWETEALVLIRHAEGLFANSPPMATLVLTVPPRIANSMRTVASMGYKTTRSSIQALLRSARREILVMAPYSHPEVVSDIAPALREAATAGAKIRICLRADEHWDNGPFVRRLREELRGLNPEIIEVVDRDHLSHAKVVLVDEIRAYIGSGNLTPHGYGRNLEAGVLVRGEVASSLAKCLAEYIRMAPVRPVPD